MLDPRGHVADRVLGMRAQVAVVWVARPLRAQVAADLTAAGLTPLLATAFDHVITSLHPSAPHAQLAILDFDTIGGAEISQLMSLRWNGSRARLIALARSGTADARRVALASIERVIRPSELAAALAPRTPAF